MIVICVQCYFHTHGVYGVLLSNGTSIRMTPYEVEDTVVKTDTKMRIAVSAFSLDENIILKDGDGFFIDVAGALETNSHAFLICTLDSQGAEEISQDTIMVRVPTTIAASSADGDHMGLEHPACLFGSSQFLGGVETERDEHHHRHLNMELKSMEVHIKYVQGLFAPLLSSAGTVVSDGDDGFVGIRRQV